MPIVLEGSLGLARFAGLGAQAFADFNTVHTAFGVSVVLELGRVY